MQFSIPRRDHFRTGCGSGRLMLTQEESGARAERNVPVLLGRSYLKCLATQLGKIPHLSSEIYVCVCCVASFENQTKREKNPLPQNNSLKRREEGATQFLNSSKDDVQLSVHSSAWSWRG